MVSYQCNCRKGHLANSFDQENSGMMGETDSLDDWILVVKHVTARDSGSYECQVNFIILINLFVIAFNISRLNVINNTSFLLYTGYH